MRIERPCQIGGTLARRSSWRLTLYKTIIDHLFSASNRTRRHTLGDPPLRPRHAPLPLHAPKTQSQQQQSPTSVLVLIVVGAPAPLALGFRVGPGLGGRGRRGGGGGGEGRREERRRVRFADVVAQFGTESAVLCRRRVGIGPFFAHGDAVYFDAAYAGEVEMSGGARARARRATLADDGNRTREVVGVQVHVVP